MIPDDRDDPVEGADEVRVDEARVEAEVAAVEVAELRRDPESVGRRGVEEVLDRLRDMGYGKVRMATVATEDVVFSLPPAVGDPRGGGT